VEPLLDIVAAKDELWHLWYTGPLQ
jgi:hypothetical protein